MDQIGNVVRHKEHTSADTENMIYEKFQACIINLKKNLTVYEIMVVYEFWKLEA